MNESNLLQTLGQVSSGSAGEILRDHLRGMAPDDDYRCYRRRSYGALRAATIQTGQQFKRVNNSNGSTNQAASLNDSERGGARKGEIKLIALMFEFARNFGQ